MKSTLPAILSLVLALLAGGYLYHSAPHRIEHLEKSFDPFAPPPLSQLSANAINVMTLGHKHVYDDFITIWLLQALMNQEIPLDTERMEGLVLEVLRHQPKLETNYLLSCIVLFEKFASPKSCQDVALLGLKAFPESWRIPMLQGYIHAVLLKEPAQAAVFFKMAASRPSRPKWVENLVTKLLSKPDLTAEDLSRSLEILQESSDSSGFSSILKKMQELANSVQEVGE